MRYRKIGRFFPATGNIDNLPLRRNFAVMLRSPCNADWFLAGLHTVHGKCAHDRCSDGPFGFRAHSQGHRSAYRCPRSIYQNLVGEVIPKRYPCV